MLGIIMLSVQKLDGFDGTAARASEMIAKPLHNPDRVIP
jgi:hypothetical protein